MFLWVTGTPVAFADNTTSIGDGAGVVSWCIVHDGYTIPYTPWGIPCGRVSLQNGILYRQDQDQAIGYVHAEEWFFFGAGEQGSASESDITVWWMAAGDQSSGGVTVSIPTTKGKSAKTLSEMYSELSMYGMLMHVGIVDEWSLRLLAVTLTRNHENNAPLRWVQTNNGSNAFSADGRVRYTITPQWLSIEKYQFGRWSDVAFLNSWLPGGKG